MVAWLIGMTLSRRASAHSLSVRKQSHQMDPDFASAVGPGIVRRWLFLGYGIYSLALDAHNLQALLDESVQRGLVVDLPDQAAVA